LTLDFVEGTDEGLLIGGDIVIPYNSIEGALTVELFNALADGEDIEKIVSDLENEVNDIFGGALDTAARGLVKVGDGRWAKGLINYRWGSISDTHKAAVKEAMKTWTSSAGNEVKFSELSETCWNNFQLGLGVIGVVKIYDTDMEPLGRSHVGYLSGNRASLEIQRNLSGENLSRTALHELGHCIGLYHEHQRHDRDKWITVTNTGSDYAIIPQGVWGWKLEWTRVRIGWWTISIPYPVYGSHLNSMVFGTFDFDSIMLYSGDDIKVKKVPAGNATLKVGEPVPINTKLSPSDIATVKMIY
jgi:hypothetical protein